MGFNINLNNDINYREKIKLPPLEGGGIMLTYRCTNRCRHCLVCGSPSRENKWLDKTAAENIFKFLNKNAPDAEIHIGGGEPFLNPQCLIDTLECAAEHKIRISYVETNAFWGANIVKHEPILKELKKIGLRSLLISVSPFHAEFIKPAATIEAVKKTREIFGYAGAFVWIPEFFNFLTKYDLSKTINFESINGELLKRAADMYYLIPGGRCGYCEPPVSLKRPAKDYFITNCERELLSTNHFHIDTYDNYMPGGLCGGLAMCHYKETADIINLNDKPLIKLLYNEGIKGLFEFAANETGYIEKTGGYCGKCHLCVDIRIHLYKKYINEKKFRELAPAEFYETLYSEINQNK